MFGHLATRSLVIFLSISYNLIIDKYDNSKVRGINECSPAICSVLFLKFCKLKEKYHFTLGWECNLGPLEWVNHHTIQWLFRDNHFLLLLGCKAPNKAYQLNKKWACITLPDTLLLLHTSLVNSAIYFLDPKYCHHPILIGVIKLSTNILRLKHNDI
jgi:hypothetical protein